MVPINYNQLYYFYKIAEEGSLAQASKKLLISSSALSMQLKELEETFGKLFFDRKGKKLVINETGRMVWEYAREIFSLGNELRHQLEDSGNNNKKDFAVGFTEMIPMQIRDQFLNFLMVPKKSKIIMKEGHHFELLQQLQESELDIVLTMDQPQLEASSSYEMKLLLREPLIIVGHSQFLSMKGHLRLISKIPFIFPDSQSPLYQKLSNFFQEKKLKLNIVAEVDSSATGIELAQNGLGVIVVIKIVENQLLKNHSLIPLYELRSLDQEIWMLMSKKKRPHEIAQLAMKDFTFSS
jgi:LysR family transcriptional activator of nhaA